MADGDSEQPPPVKDAAPSDEELRRRVLREHHLPTGGRFPFVPPKHWRPHQPLRKNSKGEYLDVSGRRWRKGPTRTEGEDWEWDVQLPNGDHLNIDWGGNITYPKPETPRRGGQPHRGLGGKKKKGRKGNAN